MASKTPLTNTERALLISLIRGKLEHLTDDELHNLYDQIVKILDKRNPDCGHAARPWR